MSQPDPKVFVVAGPTASGKTELGIDLARAQRGEIISVDSRQIYKFLAVGTAKPAGRWEKMGEEPVPLYRVQGIPYHLVDCVDPNQPFSAAQFANLARQKIAEIRSREHAVILVGGTGLYFKALFEGLAALPPANAEIRRTLLARASVEGRAALHRELASVDSAAAVAIPANNIQRVIRALEVFQLTGKPLSQWHREQPAVPTIAREVIILDPGKDMLEARIRQRCANMLDQGLIEETAALLAQGYAPDCPALSGLGYPHVIQFLKRQLTRPALLAALMQDTRQYAKRQRTWFRHQRLAPAAHSTGHATAA